MLHESALMELQFLEEMFLEMKQVLQLKQQPQKKWTEYRLLFLQNKTNIAGKGKTALQTDLHKLTQDKMIQTQRFQQKQENPSLEEECIFQAENFQII